MSTYGRGAEEAAMAEARKKGPLRMKTPMCDHRFKVDRTPSGGAYTGPFAHCTRPMNHRGKCYSSLFYRLGRHGQDLPEGCVRFETVMEPGVGFESQVFDSVVDILKGEQRWG